jgi:hypothetical protein
MRIYYHASYNWYKLKGFGKEKKTFLWPCKWSIHALIEHKNLLGFFKQKVFISKLYLIQEEE